MWKSSSAKSGIFNPRAVIAVALCAVGASFGWLSFASTPSSGTLTPSSGPVTYKAGPFNVPNQSPVGFGQLDTGPRCNAQFPCDSFALTVSLPTGYAAAHPNAAVKVTMFWTDTGSGQSDYDLYIYNGSNPTVDGNHPADHQSATSADPEVAVVNPVLDGDTQYTIEIVPVQPTQEIVSVKIELLPGSGGIFPGFGGADPTTPSIPRYQIFVPPVGSSAESGSGEFNIGFDPITHRIMVMNIGPIWRLTPGEVQTPSKPECCEALWEDKSTNTVNTGLDPILWTDQKSGRTFASNSTAGANAVYAYTDAAAPFNDGDTWVEFSPSPPNLSDDHETIGSGPYPSIPNPIPGGSPIPNPLGNAVNQGEAVYYCGQTFPVGAAFCQRSDDLGVHYGNGVPVYNGTTSACHGLHGHVHVAPDGTVWLPVPHCNGVQGGAFSTDSGATWHEFTVPGAISQTNGADPSIAIDSDSTIYYSYVNNEPVGASDPPEGHARVQVGHRNPDNTITWTNMVDLGASHGIKNAVEIEAVGGSSGRAAIGFLGTDVNGDYQADSFPGKWYPFIATTYDAGQTWVTVNATPNDPVQSMSGVWQGGGSRQDRNLLDFNEITVDDKGRVLYGYSDGCVTVGCISGTAPNDFTAHMRVARQSGGKPLLSQFDPTPAEPTVPKPACLSGTRDCAASHLTWKTPDNGGADIVNYQIFRGTTPGSETLIGQTGVPKPSFNDMTANPSVGHYFYVVKAVNAKGTGLQSNELDLSVDAVAADDVAVTAEDNPVVINVLANDCGSAPLTVTSVTAPGHGTANINGDSTVTYSPATGFFGFDSFTYALRNGQGLTATAKVRVTVTPVCSLLATGSFNDDFESGAPGWTVDTAANNLGPASATWNVMTDPNAHSPSHSFFSDATTLDVKDDRLIAPPQKLSSTSQLTFWHRFNFESGSSAGFDGGVLEVSTDGGATWVDVLAGGGSFVSGGYNGTISPSFGSRIAGRQAWTAGSPTAAADSMTQVVVNLGAFAGLDRLVRFRLVCDPLALGSKPGQGWWIDDVHFTNTQVESSCPFAVVSRKTHGSAGDFDVDLPLVGNPGIECRSGGANNLYTLIYTFHRNVTVPGTATKTQGTAIVGVPTIGPKPNQVTIPLRSVANAQHLGITLNGVHDVTGATINNLAAHMDVLLGDVDGTGRVDADDVTLVRQNNFQLLTQTPPTFREDVDLTGRIDADDVTITRQQNFTFLP